MGRESWSNGHRRRITIERSWVWIPAPDARWLIFLFCFWIIRAKAVHFLFIFLLFTLWLQIWYKIWLKIEKGLMVCLELQLQNRSHRRIHWALPVSFSTFSYIKIVSEFKKTKNKRKEGQLKTIRSRGQFNSKEQTK